ncbi:MAG: LapA family protein [Propionivibrio sp.]|uniref:LapA family protein n=1 Tax=Candidatus Propionivibrio dominans TaxID=2954373 RepID=A0A9D7FDU1_9RHOO|nr:LapA family protein [Candidatus Propionivibrio dominans]
MRALLWGCRIFIFLFLFAFALKNTDPVSVRFFLDTAWQAPLIIIVLAFFAGGAALGVLSLLGTVFGLRREVSRLQREAKTVKQATGSQST